jgi:hypothetical protein
LGQPGSWADLAGQPEITRSAVHAGGVRLLLSATRPVAEEIMGFGQAPCSAGRGKRRNVAHLGLLPPAAGGLSDITALYKTKYGEPRAGTKVFIVTRQQHNGWEGPDKVTSKVVPEPPKVQQAAAKPGFSQKHRMYKGCSKNSFFCRSADTPVASPATYLPLSRQV